VSERVDVVVVGAGAMGAASAWRLARGGRHVLVLEQFEPGHVRGSSHGATRIFRLAHRDRRYLELARRALGLWRELEAATGEVLVEATGQIDHGHAPAVEEIDANLRRAGLASELLVADAARERWPGMRFDGPVVHSPDGGRCWADRTVTAAVRAARAEGAEVRYGTPVERIEVVPAGVVVHGPGGPVRAPVVVVAAGAWVPRLLGGVVALPELAVEDEQVGHFRPHDPTAAWPSFLHHAGPDMADRPLAFGAYGLVTPGEGVKVGGPGTTVPVDPATRTLEADPARAGRLRDYVEEWLPGLDPEPLSTTRCLFTETPDDHFVLDRRGPVVVCSPCSGHGFKFVPAVAAEVEQLVAGRPQAEPAWRLP
jgi:sarcosine oxidase